MWEFLYNAGILKRPKQTDIAAECVRFASDPAFGLYLDNARYNIIEQLAGLTVDDVDTFKELKRCQMALEGLTDFIEGAIVSEKMKQRATTAEGRSN